VAAKDRDGEDGEASSGLEGADVGTSALALTALADGESGRIVRVSGSATIKSKLEAMGILVGAVIAKKSAALRRGPVVVERAGSQLALAYAIAEGIVVEPMSRRDWR
jgi:Fe2+ transport system protein FeoA